jgi:hypothetical protein
MLWLRTTAVGEGVEEEEEEMREEGSVKAPLLCLNKQSELKSMPEHQQRQRAE